MSDDGSPNSDQRDHPRVPVNIRVMFGITKADRVGFVQDVSKSGLRIRARKAFPPKTQLVMKIEIPGRGMYPLTGVVRRARVIEPALPPFEPVEMGLVVIDQSRQLLQLVEDLLAIYRNRRSRERRERRLRIRVGEAKRLIDEYTQNVGEGGVFVVSDSPPAQGDVLLTQLELPEPWGAIRAECQVVHVVDQDEAAATGRLPGAGLRFVAFSYGDDVKYREYITAAFEQSSDETS